MDWILLFLQASLEFCFLCRFTGKKTQMFTCVLFSASFSLIVGWSGGRQSVLAAVVLNVALLLFAGRRILKNDWHVSILAAVLAAGIMQLSFGLVNSIVSAASPLLYRSSPRLAVWTFCVAAVLAALAITRLSYHFLSSWFCLDQNRISPYTVILLFPLFLILLLGEYIVGAVYGNVLTIDRDGTVLGANHIQMMLLQLFAFASCFSVLYAGKRLTKSVDVLAKAALLEREADIQRQYIKEARQRYEKTKSFRHDVKNHMLVLKGLLDTGQVDEAAGYLGRMESIAGDFTFPFHTNHPVLDILLAGKLGPYMEAAEEDKKIRVECSLVVPSPCSLVDTDLCIVFANALDNAVNALEGVREGDRRYIRISGERQGDFVLAAIENGRAPGAWEGVVFGTGLSNIRAVVEKYNGAVEISQDEGWFRLNLLFCISQHSADI